MKMAIGCNLAAVVSRALRAARRRARAAVVPLLVVAGAKAVRAPAVDPPGDWLRALPGWTYRFPADHFAHPDFKTEWWYFTGNLTAAGGRQFGYELTFFRQGVLPPGARSQPPLAGDRRSRFVQPDFKFAHFAITDISPGRFDYTQRMSRGAFGDAGYTTADPGPGRPFVWLEDWTLAARTDGAWEIRAATADPTPLAIDLQLTPRKPVVIEGLDGVSQKSAGAGNASHYYSWTRLATTGTLRDGPASAALPVRGDSWFDHEWASNQLGADQIGWNWFCLQFGDGTEVMLYAMRRADGSIDPVSGGTFVAANGTAEHLRRADFELRPVRTWHSRRTGADYPVEWRVAIPAHGIDVTVAARRDDQELALPQISYWEGATSIVGRSAGNPALGYGYMELTGYAGQLSGLRAAAANAPAELHAPAP